MSAIREELIYTATQRAFHLTDTSIQDDIDKQYEFQKQIVLSDESLTEEEKTEAVKKLNKGYDRYNLRFNQGTKRICENCNQECLAKFFCELCVRKYLKENFPNWTSGNENIDDLIQACQMKTLIPSMIVEWIPYVNLQNIEYMTEGGCSKIYMANWINGCYWEWDSNKQQLTRHSESGVQNVILKRLESVESAKQSWLDEAKSHLTIGNRWEGIVQCYGLTQDPSNGDYMLVMSKMNIDLKNYLQQNHNQLTWKERAQIAFEIITALCCIHSEGAIHRDLHSGNILYLQLKQYWHISDFGFCGPANKPSKSIYGNLPYIAPEVLAGKKTTFASDIYSIGMIMWEISSGQPPFNNHKHDFDFAINIINGIRPKPVPGTPLEYKRLMEQCWDANPLKRPRVYTLLEKMGEIDRYHQNIPYEQILPKINNNFKTNHTSNRLFTSKVYEFTNMPEPRNATKEEQEAFYTKSCDFNILDNNDKNLFKEFNKLQINPKNDENENL